VNKEGKTVVALLESMTVFVDAPEEEVLVSALVEELDKRRLHNSKIENEITALENYQVKTAAVSDHMREAGNQIKALEDDISQLRTKKANLELSLKERGKTEAEKEREIADMVKANTQEIVNQISTAEEVNQQVRSNQKRAETENEVKQLREKSKTFTEQIEQIDLEKEKQLSEAKFPIDGLAFDEDGVLFNEMPWNQLSSWDQLNISAAIGFGKNPKLKVLLIRDGSLIDNDNLKRLAKMIPEDGQIWLERVGEGEEVSVIIEDGSIKGD
jgi:septal ring factor EnvC (AmiA/AmiB activator)